MQSSLIKEVQQTGNSSSICYLTSDYDFHENKVLYAVIELITCNRQLSN